MLAEEAAYSDREASLRLPKISSDRQLRLRADRRCPNDALGHLGDADSLA